MPRPTYWDFESPNQGEKGTTLTGYLEGRFSNPWAPSTIYIASLKNYPDFIKIGFCQVRNRQRRFSDSEYGEILFDLCEDKELVPEDIPRAEAYICEKYLFSLLMHEKEFEQINDLRKKHWSGYTETFKVPKVKKKWSPIKGYLKYGINGLVFNEISFDREKFIERIRSEIKNTLLNGDKGWEKMLDQIVILDKDKSLYLKRKRFHPINVYKEKSTIIYELDDEERRLEIESYDMWNEVFGIESDMEEVRNLMTKLWDLITYNETFNEIDINNIDRLINKLNAIKFNIERIKEISNKILIEKDKLISEIISIEKERRGLKMSYEDWCCWYRPYSDENEIIIKEKSDSKQVSPYYDPKWLLEKIKQEDANQNNSIEIETPYELVEKEERYYSKDLEKGFDKNVQNIDNDKWLAEKIKYFKENKIYNNDLEEKGFPEPDADELREQEEREEEDERLRNVQGFSWSDYPVESKEINDSYFSNFDQDNYWNIEGAFEAAAGEAEQRAERQAEEAAEQFFEEEKEKNALAEEEWVQEDKYYLDELHSKEKDFSIDIDSPYYDPSWLLEKINQEDANQNNNIDIQSPYELFEKERVDMEKELDKSLKSYEKNNNNNISYIEPESGQQEDDSWLYWEENEGLTYNPNDTDFDNDNYWNTEDVFEDEVGEAEYRAEQEADRALENMQFSYLKDYCNPDDLNDDDIPLLSFRKAKEFLKFSKRAGKVIRKTHDLWGIEFFSENKNVQEEQIGINKIKSDEINESDSEKQEKINNNLNCQYLSTKQTQNITFQKRPPKVTIGKIDNIKDTHQKSDVNNVINKDKNKKINIESKNTDLLLRKEDLIKSTSNNYSALQIYHPKTTSDLFNSLDQRILDFKDGAYRELCLYAIALKMVIPRNTEILLTCAPGSKSNQAGSLNRIIKSLSGGPIKDGSNLLKTKISRQKKSHGYKFSDLELYETIELNKIEISDTFRILILDDVITTGQTFNVCKKILKDSGYKNEITCLGLGMTNRTLYKKSIVDDIKIDDFSDPLSPINIITKNINKDEPLIPNEIKNSVKAAARIFFNLFK